jgi:hypothetical protein
MRTPNRQTLESVARQLGPLLGKVVFVGGQVTELLLTDRRWSTYATQMTST